MPHEKVFEEIECNRIDRLFQEYDPLLEKIKEQEPDFIEKIKKKELRSS